MKWWDWMPWSLFSECWVLSQLFHSPLSLASRVSLVLRFLPWVWCHLHISGYWYFSQQSWLPGVAIRDFHEVKLQWALPISCSVAHSLVLALRNHLILLPDLSLYFRHLRAHSQGRQTAGFARIWGSESPYAEPSWGQQIHRSQGSLCGQWMALVGLHR